MSEIDKMLARAQVWIAVLALLGFLGLLTALIFWPRPMSQAMAQTITGLLAVLGTILTLQMNFFYARHRQGAIPDPATTSTTTISTTQPVPTSGVPNVAPLSTSGTITVRASDPPRV